MYNINDSMNLNRTVLATYPRSGNGFLQRILKEYYGDRLKFHEQGKNDDHNKIEGFNLIKNHDFNLDTPILKDWLYITQIRHPYFSIQSLFDMNIAKGRTMKYSHEHFKKFLDEKLEFWIRFHSKWSSSNYILVYENLMTNCEDELEKVIRIMSPDDVDIPKIKELAKQANSSRFLALNPLFKLEDLIMVETKVSKQLELLGIEKVAEQTALELSLIKENELANRVNTYYQRLTSELLLGYNNSIDGKKVLENTYQDTLSWRITKPLRLIKKLIK